MKVTLDVPMIRQLQNHCVPASLAMVFQYFGYDYTQKEIAKWFKYDIKEKGVYKLSDIVYCARAHNFVAHAREGIGLEGIVRTIDRGLPMIAVINFSGIRSACHAIVVCGYEITPSAVWMNDPLKARRSKMAYSDFASLWGIRREEGGTNQYGVIIHE